MHPVGEVAVDVEGQGCVADGDVELDLRHEERNKITRITVSHLFKMAFSLRFIISCSRFSVGSEVIFQNVWKGIHFY